MVAVIPDTLVAAVRALPTTIASGQGGELIDTATAYQAIKILTDVVNATSGGTGTGTGTAIPDQTLAVRLANSQNLAVPIVYAGSSTFQGLQATTKAARCVDLFHVGTQLARPSGRASSDARSLETLVQDSPGGTGFTAIAVPGVHGYNAGQSGAKSNDFLLNANIPALAALGPAAWVIQVGSNDAVDGVLPDTYKANLQGKINAIKAATPAGSPFAIYLLHQYLRPSSRNPTYPWTSYFAALQAIADADPTVVRAIDLSNALPGVPGPDNASALATGLIDSDLIHMTNAGHKLWAAAMYQAVFGATIPVGNANYVGPVAVSGSDTFSGGASTTALAGWVSALGTWGVTSDGKASLMATAPGVATRAVGLRNGQYGGDLIYPASGFLGLRVRVNGANEGISCYMDKAAGTVNLTTITNGANASLTPAVPIPAGIVAGQTVSFVMTFVDDQIGGWVNGTQVISATLTPAQLSAYQGTGIALRQTVVGVANGTFDNMAWSDTVTITGGGTTSPGSGTIVASDNFAGAAGAAWSSQWVSNYGTGVPATVNGANGGLLVTPATAFGAARTQYLSTVAAAADMEIRYDWQSDGTLAEQPFRAALRSPGTQDTGNGSLYSCYELTINPASTTGIVLQRRVNTGTGTVLGSMPWTFVAGQKISVRFQTVGSTIQFRAWVAGTAEPTAWSLTVTDTGITVAGRPFFKYINGNAATSRTGILSNLTVSLPGSTSGGTGDVAFTATANTPMPVGNLPGWDQVVAEDFLTDVAAGSSGFRTAYPNMTTYDGFGDTAWKAIVNRTGVADPTRAAWYSDKTLSVANSQLVCRVGWDSALQKNLTSFVLPRRYTGQVMGRVDFLLRADVILNYKIVPLWWSAANPDLWSDGEIDYPESNDLGTTFKGYIHDTLGTPINNVFAKEPITIPGNATAPRLDSWHVFSQRWTETEISFWLDGVKVVSYTKPTNGNGFPTNPMRFGFQIEARDLGGNTVISQTAIGNVQIGWVVQYLRNAATA